MVFDHLDDSHPDLLDRFNDRLFRLEEAQAVDERLDQFVRSNRASFFR